MGPKEKTEYIIEDVVGCGLFQVVLFIIVIFVSKAGFSFSVMFMAFGNYNPGWRCLDNVTIDGTNNTFDDLNDVEYTQGSCDDYNRCHHVEFNPETSTVVTEWGLLCDKAWIPSMIISLQMVGMLIGSLVGGQLSDLYGRKTIFYSSCAGCAALHLLSSFSNSWIMLMVVRFLLAIFFTSMLVISYIKTAEFIPLKWRGLLMNMPCWNIGALFQALAAMGLKDWSHLERVSCLVYVIIFIPVFWAPESLRFLEVKGKIESFERLSTKIAKWNRKTLPSLNELETHGYYKEVKDDKKYTTLDMFRPGYKYITLSVGFVDFTFNIIFYALSFGVKSLYGDFYVNLIIPTVIAIPILLSAAIIVRYISRISTNLMYLILAVACLFGATGCVLSHSDDARAYGGTILISISKASIEAAWVIIYLRVTEIYPTVIRSTALGFASLSARAGGILVPFVIPNDKSKLYIFIITSAVLLLFCCFLCYKLPETKGKELKATFDDETKNETKDTQNVSTVDQML